MQLTDLDYAYPPELVATEPRRPSRVLVVRPGQRSTEETVGELLAQIPTGDILVINDTKVSPMRVWSLAGDEVLFVHRINDLEWDVLFPARHYPLQSELRFPDGLTAVLTEKGLPQRVRLSRELSPGYLEKFGEPALPPYIQDARGERHARREDFDWYQSRWASVPGSAAAPTASLHFSQADLEGLRARGVAVTPITLHVGLGTFLPIKGSLESHRMHSESVHIPATTARAVRSGGRVWALGTTVARALEAWGRGAFSETDDGFWGGTDLFITPGYEFQIVDRLLTNFHQPRSTLLALVMAFAGPARVREAYRYAIENRFRFFSYGDLSAWIK